MGAKLKFIETHNDKEIYDKFVDMMKERFTSIKAQILQKLENNGKMMPYKVRKMLEEKLKNIDKKLDYFKNSNPEQALRDVMMMRWSNLKKRRGLFFILQKGWRSNRWGSNFGKNWRFIQKNRNMKQEGSFFQKNLKKPEFNDNTRL